MHKKQTRMEKHLKNFNTKIKSQEFLKKIGENS